LVNEQTDEQLEQMTTIIGSGGAAAATASALYTPAGAGGNPYPLLKGRPVLIVEQSPVLGTTGDIVLADLRHYVIIDGGINLALSLDVSFLNDQAVFRFVLRIDGGPVFTSPITSYQGSAQRSPFVALASR
jgi:HK97 family phage major capsid protein